MGLRTQSVGKKTLAIALTIVPGLGHVVLDRHTMGCFLFTVFALSANGAFIGARLWINDQQKFAILLLSTLGLVLVYPKAFISIWRLTFGRDESERARTRAGQLKKAVSHYLQGQHDEATGILRTLLRQDGLDVDSLFYLAMIHRDRGEKANALKTFRRCAALGRKWKWEVAQEVRALNAG